MNENAAKLNKLRKEIEGCSESEAEAIIVAALKSADETLRAAEKELKRAEKSNTRETVEKFRIEERRRVSEVRFSEGKRVLMHRAGLADEFFARVEAEIKEKTAGEEYSAYLAGAIAEAQKHYSLENAEIYCREADMAAVKALADKIQALVLPSADIALGGIIVKIPEKGIIMDLSLDAALENERERFSSCAQMQL